MIAVSRFYEQDILMEIEISEMVEKLKDKFNDTFVNNYKNKIDEMKKSLINAGVDIKELEENIRPKAILAAQKLKNGDSQGLINIVSEIFSEIKDSFIIKQIAISLVLVAIVVIINSILLNGLITVFGLAPEMALILIAIFMAPLTEETGKFLSVKYGATGIHFIIFNFVEFSLYIARAIGLGISLPAQIIGRLIVVLLHFLLTTIHFKAAKNKEQLKGWGIAASIHFMWNFFTCLPQILSKI